MKLCWLSVQVIVQLDVIVIWNVNLSPELSGILISFGMLKWSVQFAHGLGFGEVAQRWVQSHTFVVTWPTTLIIYDKYPFY